MNYGEPGGDMPQQTQSETWCHVQKIMPFAVIAMMIVQCVMYDSNQKAHASQRERDEQQQKDADVIRARQVVQDAEIARLKALLGSQR